MSDKSKKKKEEENTLTSKDKNLIIFESQNECVKYVILLSNGIMDHVPVKLILIHKIVFFFFISVFQHKAFAYQMPFRQLFRSITKQMFNL